MNTYSFLQLFFKHRKNIHIKQKQIASLIECDDLNELHIFLQA